MRALQKVHGKCILLLIPHSHEFLASSYFCTYWPAQVYRCNNEMAASGSRLAYGLITIDYLFLQHTLI